MHITDEFGCSDNANITLFPPDCAIDAEVIDSIAQDSTILPPPNDTTTTNIDTMTTIPTDTSVIIDSIPQDSTMLPPPNDTIATNIDTTTTTSTDTSVIVDSIPQDSTMLPPPNDTIATNIDTTTTTSTDTSVINPPLPASVELLLEQNYYIPTAFSPNFDGLNDRFTIFANDKVRAINSLKIFDRWGNLVFEQRDFLPNQINGSWDGTFQGQLMDAAVFIFCAEVEMNTGEIVLANGDFVLIRE